MSSVITPWGEIGYIVYKRTYARAIGDKTEEFAATIDRVIAACDTQLNVNFTAEEAEYARYIMLNLKGTVAGRFLWQLGSSTVDKYGLASLQNCAATVVDHPVKPFCWAFDMLMLGAGVGFNIQREYVYKMPLVLDEEVHVTRKDTTDADFIVPDTREGWVELLERVLSAFFYTGKGFTYSTICVRPKGSLIKGFGGVAAGPDELCWGIEQIGNVIRNRRAKQLRPIDCLDIMNIIGCIVVSGNVRRSAEIAIGDLDDRQFLNAKRFDLGSVPKWRAMSNNSVVCNDFSLLPDDFWHGYLNGGEPYGLINLKLSREVGRLIDGNKYSDKKIMGFNPCCEQPLEDKETCCLAEVFLPNIESQEEFLKVITILYRINKHSLMLPCHQKDTQKVVHKNMRMGIGVTGILQATEEQVSWLKSGYQYLRAFDKEYSKKMGWSKSIKLTTVKPSGTLSLLAGVTPGIHPAIFRHYVRRVRMPSDSYLVGVCRKHGYKTEYARNFDGSEDKLSTIIEFPCKNPDCVPVAKDFTAVDQLNWIKRMQTEWSDNAVSCTVYYRKDEIEAIKQWLNDNYNMCVKSVSFLLHTEHGFDQAPYEEITEEQYTAIKSSVRPITSLSEQFDMNENFECASGVCPVR